MLLPREQSRDLSYRRVWWYFSAERTLGHGFNAHTRATLLVQIEKGMGASLCLRDMRSTVQWRLVWYFIVIDSNAQHISTAKHKAREREQKTDNQKDSATAGKKERKWEKLWRKTPTFQHCGRKVSNPCEQMFPPCFCFGTQKPPNQLAL